MGRLVAIVCLAVVLGVAPLHAQTAQNVAVVINDASPDSLRVGEHYARVRSVPSSQVIRIRTSVSDEIDRDDYLRDIEQPIISVLTQRRLQDRVLYIVLTKGVPLRIGGTTGTNGTIASVDSELTLLYRRMLGLSNPPAGSLDNPYFLGERPLNEARRFGHRDHDIYLVTRLDAYTADEAIALIDRGLNATTTGRVVLDQRDALTNRFAEDWLDVAAARLKEQGFGERVLLERTPKPVRDTPQVIGYFGWGSNDPQNRVRRLGLGFVPGAIAANIVGSDARTFTEPPATWVPSDVPTSRPTWYAGTPESLIGDLIREGVTGVAGSVSESYFLGSVRPHVLLPAYLAGFNLAEAFYMAIPRLSWRTVVIGDPLVGPFTKTPVPRSDIEGEVDDTTTLPGYFSARRLRVATALASGIPPRAVALALRGDALSARGEREGARAALESSVKLAPTYVGPLLKLAMMDEEDGRRSSAIQWYRRVLAVQPNNVLALNNLAYGLAVHGKAPAEALPHAQRAATLAPNNSSILDTLAWVHHLNGNSAEAQKVIARAIKASAPAAETHLHAAIIFAATGTPAVAAAQLEEALRRNPALENTEEVRELRQKLGARRP